MPTAEPMRGQARHSRGEGQEVPRRKGREESGTSGAKASTATAAGTAHEHRRGLWIVGIYKLAKAIFFTALGAGALKLVHANLGDLALRLIDWVHMDSEGRAASFLMDRADLIGHHQLRQSALFSFLYAGLCVIEGSGLMLEKRWAEYLTVILTAMALPWEAYELMQHFALYKVALTVLNIAVLLYLLWVLKKRGLLGRG
jgi:uncharacterized membrane protein (DUF2068 family)